MATRADRTFFTLQSLLKYVPFEWTARLRGRLYRHYLADGGADLRVYDNVLIKYPSEIRLGPNVTINQGCIVVGLGGLEIGANAMLAAGTKIVTTGHGADRPDISMREQPMRSEPISIGDDVWFGFDAKVLPGVTIGDGSIVAAGAVVVHDVPPYAVVAGVPATVVRSRR